MTDLMPLYPYVGGKGRMIGEFSLYLQQTDTYIEPFFGGGAVFCYMRKHNLANRYIINDLNPELIKIFKDLQFDATSIYEEFKQHEDYYFALPIDERQYLFNAELDNYNREMTSGRLLFILNTSFGSHWYRDINTGKLSLSSGHNRIKSNTGTLIAKDEFYRWHKALEGVDITCVDYRSIDIPDNSIVFCDPPYLGVDRIYYKMFSNDDQKICFNWCCEISRNPEVSVIQTNNTDGIFFEAMLKGEVNVKHFYYRARHSSTGNTKPADEIVMIWNPLFNDPKRFGLYI